MLPKSRCNARWTLIYARTCLCRLVLRLQRLKPTSRWCRTNKRHVNQITFVRPGRTSSHSSLLDAPSSLGDGQIQNSALAPAICSVVADERRCPSYSFSASVFPKMPMRCAIIIRYVQPLMWYGKGCARVLDSSLSCRSRQCVARLLVSMCLSLVSIAKDGLEKCVTPNTSAPRARRAAVVRVRHARRRVNVNRAKDASEQGREMHIPSN
jgi:hypothetical protein